MKENTLLINRVLHDVSDISAINMFVLEMVEIPAQENPMTDNECGFNELLKNFESCSTIPQLTMQISTRTEPDYTFDSIEDADKFLWEMILHGNIYGSDAIFKFKNINGFGVGTSFRLYCNSAAVRGRRGPATLLMGKELYDLSEQYMTMGEYDNGFKGDSTAFNYYVELNESIPDKMIVGVYTGRQKFDGVGNYRVLEDGKIQMVLSKNWKDHMVLLRYE